MTSKLTREQATDTEIQMLIDSHEKGTAMFMRTDAYYFMAKELQERRKSAMDSEPVAEVCEDYAIRYISSGPAPKEGLHPGDKLYRHAQPAPVVPGKWIPVSEQMPEDRTQVILWDAEIGEVTSGHYSHKTHTFYHCGDAIENEITHWMPPPCAPQEVNRE